MPLPEPVTHHIERLRAAAFDEVRAQAAQALSHHPDHVLELLPHLVKALGDPGPVVIVAAAGTLASFGAAAAPAIPHLARQARHDNPVVREHIAAALERIR